MSNKFGSLNTTVNIDVYGEVKSIEYLNSSMHAYSPIHPIRLMEILHFCFEICGNGATNVTIDCPDVHEIMPDDHIPTILLSPLELADINIVCYDKTYILPVNLSCTITANDTKQQLQNTSLGVVQRVISDVMVNYTVLNTNEESKYLCIQSFMLKFSATHRVFQQLFEIMLF